MEITRSKGSSEGVLPSVKDFWRCWHGLGWGWISRRYWDGKVVKRIISGLCRENLGEGGRLLLNRALSSPSFTQHLPPS